MVRIVRSSHAAQPFPMTLLGHRGESRHIADLSRAASISPNTADLLFAQGNAHDRYKFASICGEVLAPGKRVCEPIRNCQA
jgi:hypothetical protein